MPANVELNLSQYLELILIAEDSHYDADADPYETGVFQPDEWPLIAVLPDPYSITMSADFADTLRLDTLTLWDTEGNVAEGQFISANGVIYPTETLVPEPQAALTLVMELAWFVVGRRTMQRPARPLRRDAPSNATGGKLGHRLGP